MMPKVTSLIVQRYSIEQSRTATAEILRHGRAIWRIASDQGDSIAAGFKVLDDSPIIDQFSKARVWGRTIDRDVVIWLDLRSGLIRSMIRLGIDPDISAYRFKLPGNGTTLFGCAWQSKGGAFGIDLRSQSVTWWNREIRHPQRIIASKDGQYVLVISHDQTSEVLSQKTGESVQRLGLLSDDADVSPSGRQWVVKRMKSRTIDLLDQDFAVVKRVGCADRDRFDQIYDFLFVGEDRVLLRDGPMRCYSLDQRLLWELERIWYVGKWGWLPAINLILFYGSTRTVKDRLEPVPGSDRCILDDFTLIDPVDGRVVRTLRAPGGAIPVAGGRYLADPDTDIAVDTLTGEFRPLISAPLFD